nr:hypothetical protein [Tanacetum cinerariifolium]
MPTKIELTLEQSQQGVSYDVLTRHHGPSDEMHNPSQPYSKDGNPARANIKQALEQADWRDDTDDKSEDQELEVHYIYIAQIQEVTPDAANDSGPIFDTEP